MQKNELRRWRIFEIFHAIITLHIRSNGWRMFTSIVLEYKLQWLARRRKLSLRRFILTFNIPMMVKHDFAAGGLNAVRILNTIRSSSKYFPIITSTTPAHLEVISDPWISVIQNYLNSTISLDPGKQKSSAALLCLCNEDKVLSLIFF